MTDGLLLIFWDLGLFELFLGGCTWYLGKFRLQHQFSADRNIESFSVLFEMGSNW